jgi:16S rRNA (guanine1207-N2)-methyltransferase
MALAAAGYQVSVTPLPAATALICLPRSKTEALGLIAEAVRQGARMVLVDGQKTDGVESVQKAVRSRVALGGTVSKAHGKLFWFAPGAANFDDWAVQESVIAAPGLGRFRTVPGLFSADGVDPGSELLVRHLPASLPPQMADLGAGWGYLSAACLARDGIERLHLVEAEARALELARANVPDPRAEFHWADATSFHPPEPVGGVIMNPPFHTGRKAQPGLGLAFIAAAARMLSGKGQLWMVANRHLPYDGALAELFATHQCLAETPVFRVWHATGPRTRSKTVIRHRR